MSDVPQYEWIVSEEPFPSEVPSDVPDDVLREESKFTTKEEAISFYQNYGASKGFDVRIRSSAATQVGISDVTNVRLVCNREGIYKSRAKKDKGVTIRNTSHTQCGCKAGITVSYDKNEGLWVVNTFSDVHNHALTTPSKRVRLRVNRNYSGVAKSLTSKFAKEVLEVGKVPNFFGGILNAPFSSRDCWNYVRKLREEQNGAGDADSVQKYFSERAAREPYFYYQIDTDSDGRAVNFFWVDGHSRLAYKIFGDVVTFDTTYRTNKYCMPCGPFTGVNHHRQSILFGCCLIENEVEETFVWVFEKWLEAMGGVAPPCIITDQDQAMTNAIQKVFPLTRHKYCMWHIKKKFGEKLGNMYFKRSTFKKELKNAIHNTWSEQEFEEQWNSVLAKHGLQNHEWLKDMFEIRHMWIPTYCRQTFSAGMKTTQRSESMNSFFNKYFTTKTNLLNFVHGYNKALEKLKKNELDENWVSIDKDRSLRVDHHLLEHAARVYTRNIFDKFEKEFKVHHRFKAIQTQVEGDDVCFTVTYLTGIDVEWYVRMNFTSMVGSCSCCLFDFRGIPCRHLLHICVHKYIMTIPPYFILRRWTKEATKIEESGTSIAYYGDGANTIDEATYASDFINRSMRLCYMAARSERGRVFMNEYLNKGFESLNEIEDQLLLEEHSATQSSFDPAREGASMVVSTTHHEETTVRVERLLLDPHISQTKGRKKNKNKDSEEVVVHTKRIKGGLELSQRRARVCSICHKKAGHNARTCPLRDKHRILEEEDESEDDELDVDLDRNSQ